MKQELHVIQKTKPSWAIKSETKLVDLEDHPRQNNVRPKGIKEREKDSWQDCENKIYNLLKKWTLNGQSASCLERAHQIGKKKKNRWLPIVAAFSFCEDKVNILKDYEKLKNTTFSIFEDFP